ncbi:hypothetical protein OIU77_010159 [Salix suchowensis]|uniref:Uncharacterized protein n=1 Tax=Salix suchowensis TaxID=1278906 RepID=A0ABQ9A8K5_9ROSI|nr:hypothetical protein OIU77_010159 [Salix suchowensis]
MHQHSPRFGMRKQRYFGYPVGRIGKSSRRTLKSRGLGRQNFGCHCGANLSRSDESLQGFIISCNAVFLLLVPFLIGVIQIKFQGTNQSPFQTRLPSMWASVLATFVYCFALAATMKFKCTKYGRFSGHVAFLAGSFSSISLHRPIHMSVDLPKDHRPIHPIHMSVDLPKDHDVNIQNTWLLVLDPG